MVKNIGLSINSTHAPQNLLELPKDVQRMFNEPAEEIEFPLKHPPYIIEDYHYFDKVMKIINPNVMVRFRRKIAHQIRRMGIRMGIIK